jgi:heptaprenyl diphosphate synthase
MPLPTANDGGHTIILKTTLLLVAITVNALELFLPRIPFLPWLKPGLANCVTIVWIIRYGTVDAVFFSLLRVWLVGFYTGFSFISLCLSLSGGVLASFVMGTVWYVLGRRGLIGTIGLAIIGAMFHNLGQLIAVYFLLTYNVYLFYQVPFMILASIGFGSLVGVLAPMLGRISDRALEKTRDSVISLPSHERVPPSYTILSVSMLLLSICLVFIDTRFVLVALALLITGSVQVILGPSVQNFFFPIRRFWLLFVFVACLLLFLPYGKKVSWAPWITYEGLEATIHQWLRLWIWLQISFMFTYFRFHTVVLRVLSFLFRPYTSTLYSGLLALEDFPGVFDLLRKRISMEFRDMFRHPVDTSKNAIRRAFYDVTDSIVLKHRKMSTKTNSDYNEGG